MANNSENVNAQHHAHSHVPKDTTIALLVVYFLCALVVSFLWLLRILGAAELYLAAYGNVTFVFVAIACGCIGSVIYAMISLDYHLGHGDFDEKWRMWYLLRPITGTALAVLVYFVLIAGLDKAGQVDVAHINSVAAIAGLTGLFSRQASDWLGRVAGAVFNSPATEAGAKGNPAKPGGKE